MTKSPWEESSLMPEFPTLSEDIKTDVLIIGGGICGILCAYFLKEAGVDCVLAEGNKILSGTTKNTTAKITIQHGLIYSKLIKNFGKETAQIYLSANRDALEMFAKMSKDIECDFEIKDSYVYTLKNRRKIEDEVLAVNSLDYFVRFKENPSLPFKTEGALCFTNQAQFNPLKFCVAISKNLKIYENTFIRKISNGEAISENGKIKAKKFIITTHFPFINKHGSYFMKLYQHRSYVAAFENAVNFSDMYVDENKTGLSFRNYGSLLLIGGGGHRTGKSGGAWKEINDFAKHYYPDAIKKYEWAAQDCMSLDGIPYIGQYSMTTPDLYVATGFNKWGMTSSMAAASLLCDMVQDKKNEFEKLFSPQRSILKPQLFINGFETAKNMLSLTTKRCPHLGCALKWNKAEHTWDCPCHGSRFDEEGNVIENPAMDDLH